MKQVRCMFRIDEVIRKEGYAGQSERNVVRASAITTSTGKDATPEEQAFTKFTPSGELEFSCDNPALVGTFAPGDRFYLDLTPA